MAQIKYSQDLLKDFDELKKWFVNFMTNVLMHSDQNLIGRQKAEMKQLNVYSQKNSRKILYELDFKYPLLGANEQINKDKLLKNFQNLINFFHNYLDYAEPIMRRNRQDLYSNKFLELKKSI